MKAKTLLTRAKCVETKGRYEKMMAFIYRREWLERNCKPQCPNCKDKSQQQMVDWIVSPICSWRCRICKEKYMYED